jgi:hypothetical protein
VTTQSTMYEDLYIETREGEVKRVPPVRSPQGGRRLSVEFHKWQESLNQTP